MYCIFSSSSGFWVGKCSLLNWKKYFPSAPSSSTCPGEDETEDVGLPRGDETTEQSNSKTTSLTSVKEEIGSSEDQERLERYLPELEGSSEVVGTSSDKCMPSGNTSDGPDDSHIHFNEDVRCIHGACSAHTSSVIQWNLSVCDLHSVSHAGQLTPVDSQKKLVSAEAWSLFEKYFPNSPKYGALDYQCQVCMV